MILLFLTGGLEIGLASRGSLSRPGRVLAVADLVFLGVTTGALLAEFNVFFGLLALVNGYRALNMLRLFERRMHPAYLRRAATRTALVLLTLQLLIVSVSASSTNIALPAGTILSGVVLTQLTVAIILLLSTIRTLVKTKYRAAGQHFADRDLPTVTVAIPARNETRDLTDCLRSVLANDYPKLEILVLDDCSQNKTPEIIRDFAHDGVRFIRGAQPRDNWLAKNQAYARLAEEASGAFILFCGVDVRLDSQTIRRLVTAALVKQKRMLCVLPKRYDSNFGLALIQPLRYWWEVALPRRLFNRPPVLSSCWLIEKRAVKKAGGFAAVSRMIIPESYFARALTATDDYSFVRSNELLNVRTVKSFARQAQTAIRTRYPQLHRRPENLALITIGEIFLILLPFGLAIGGFWATLGHVHLLALLTSGALLLTNCLIVTSTNPANWWLAIFNFPFVTIADILITHISCYKYEFSTVIWKGRNICAPVMHVTPHLPAPGK